MKTVVIKTQKELDSLPSEFLERTTIEIRSSEVIHVSKTYKNGTIYAYESATVHAHNSATIYAYESARVYAHGSSTIYAYNSSTVDARDSATVHANDSSTVYARVSSVVNAYLCSFILVHSVHVKIKALMDNSRLIYRTGNGQRPEKQDSTAIITEFKDLIAPTFDQWLERGFVVADGIYQKLVSQKTIGNVTVYETDQGFVARIGNKFAHGKTIEEANNDLRYKVSDRDTSKYESWNLDDVKGTDELIESYIAITGACSFGTKQFCESIQLKDSYAVKEIIEMTEGKFGNKEYSEFFNK